MSAEIEPPQTQKMLFGFFPVIERWLLSQSLIGDKPYFESELFPWIEEMEQATAVIQSELVHILKHKESLPGFEEILTDQVKLTSDRRWKSFFFKGYNEVFDQNCALCPGTWSALQNIPGLRTAFFSVLEPRKSIPRHRGPYKGVLRYHLALKVPKDAESCAIWVDDIRYVWREAQSVVFDDTYFHYVKNDTDEARVVLFVDFDRPMKPLARWVNERILNIVQRSSFVQDARKNHEKWERENGGKFTS